MLGGLGLGHVKSRVGRQALHFWDVEKLCDVVDKINTICAHSDGLNPRCRALEV